MLNKTIFIIALIFNISIYSNTKVQMKTSLGSITIELFDTKAPVTVKNFLKYVRSNFYNGTIFHRVIKDFMIQGGGFDLNLTKRRTNKPIINESNNKIPNEYYTIAMARTSDPKSATSQFFINTSNNSFLNYKGEYNGGAGYAVFGKVIKGQSVINKIQLTATKRNGPFLNLPMKNIIISTVKVLTKN